MRLEREHSSCPHLSTSGEVDNRQIDNHTSAIEEGGGEKDGNGRDGSLWGGSVVTGGGGGDEEVSRDRRHSTNNYSPTAGLRDSEINKQ